MKELINGTLSARGSENFIIFHSFDLALVQGEQQYLFFLNSIHCIFMIYCKKRGNLLKN